MNGICLRGITWNHSRAFSPLVAASQRFEELNPGIHIVWEKQRLDDFGHADPQNCPAPTICSSPIIPCWGKFIAISANYAHTKTSLDFCLFVAERHCQSHLYGVCGGQPANSSAWRDPLLNRVSHDFFERTLASIQIANVRPRYPGYVALQRAAGIPIIEYLRHETTAVHGQQRLDRLYRQSLPKLLNEPEIIR